MSKICESFAQEYNVAFNAKKTVCIKYGSKIMEYDKLYIGNQVIEWSDKSKAFKPRFLMSGTLIFPHNLQNMTYFVTKFDMRKFCVVP